MIFVVRKQYSKSDIKQFLEQTSFAQQYVDKKSQLVEDDGVLYLRGEVFALLVEEEWVPSLRLLLKNPSLLPHVVVDKGAIKFVVNGADVMRPGIVRVDAFEQGAVVVIVDEGYGKPLAVGKALFSTEELMAQKGGKSVTMLHHIGDAYWEKSA